MRFHALATDYDGTIASQGHVNEETIQALQQWKKAGHKLILVTGRELDDLFRVFQYPDLFDRIVAENGALLYRPATREERLLHDPPKPAFAELLRQRGVAPLSVGRVIVATVEPNESRVLPAIRDLGLELQVIFNKGAVMILPSGVNKATGLEAALGELGLSRHNVVGVGDAENDHAFLEYCECSAAVANSLPALKDRADIVLSLPHGAGVAELIGQMLADDLVSAAAKLTRHELVLGAGVDGQELRIPPCGKNLLVAGGSGTARTAWVSRWLERLSERQYQACLLDTRGVYADLKAAIVFGDHQRPPALDDVLRALDQPKGHIVVHLGGVSLEDRPSCCQQLLQQWRALRAQTGRPHWIVLDDAAGLHPMGAPLPEGWPQAFGSCLFVAEHPKNLAAPVLDSADLALVVGSKPGETLREIAGDNGPSPFLPAADGDPLEALGWWRGQATGVRLRLADGKDLRPLSVLS